MPLQLANQRKNGARSITDRAPIPLHYFFAYSKYVPQFGQYLNNDFDTFPQLEQVNLDFTVNGA